MEQDNKKISVNLSPSELESQPETKPSQTHNDAIARSAVRLALGEDNDYLQRLLMDNLEGHNKKHTTKSILELLVKPDRSLLKKNLKQSVTITRQKAIDVLHEPINENGETLHQLCLKHNVGLCNFQSTPVLKSSSAPLEVIQQDKTVSSTQTQVDIHGNESNDDNLTETDTQDRKSVV